MSHLARGYHANGDLPKAVQSSVAASVASPDHAKFWYETAVYHVRDSNIEDAVRCLQRAIGIDWTYWSISLSDANLDSIRNRVERLLAALREEQRLIARKRLEHFSATMATLRGMQIGPELEESEKCLHIVRVYIELAQSLSMRHAAYEKANLYTTEEKEWGRLQMILGGWLLAFPTLIFAGGAIFGSWQHLLGLAVCLPILAFCIRIPVRNFFTGYLSAKNLEGRIPERLDAIKRLKAENVARLAQEKARLR